MSIKEVAETALTAVGAIENPAQLLIIAIPLCLSLAHFGRMRHSARRIRDTDFADPAERDSAVKSWIGTYAKGRTILDYAFGMALLACCWGPQPGEGGGTAAFVLGAVIIYLMTEVRHRAYRRANDYARLFIGRDPRVLVDHDWR